MKIGSLRACHECDLVHQLGEVVSGTARCVRCGASLYKPKHNSIDRTLAFTLAGAILFVIANLYPFLGFRIGAQIRETTLATGIYELYFQDMSILATLVLITVIVIPGIHLLCLLFIVVPLRLHRIPPYLPKVFGLYLSLKPWGMMEIFLLGILVASIKLVKMATILPGVALYAFLALIFILAAIVVVLDDHLIWELVEYR